MLWARIQYSLGQAIMMLCGGGCGDSGDDGGGESNEGDDGGGDSTEGHLWDGVSAWYQSWCRNRAFCSSCSMNSPEIKMKVWFHIN